jgi:hypothetical protein
LKIICWVTCTRTSLEDYDLRSPSSRLVSNNKNCYLSTQAEVLPITQSVHFVTSLDNFSIFVAVTDSVSFTYKTHANTSYYIAQNAANDFPLSWGRGWGGRHH